MGGVLLVLSPVKTKLERSSEGSLNEGTLESTSSDVPQKNPSTPKPLLGVHMIGVTDRRTDTGNNRKVKLTDCPKQAPQIRLRDFYELKNLNKKKDRCFSLRDF